MWNNKKDLKVNLWDAAVYLKLSFLKSSSQYGSWIGLVSSVFSLFSTFFSKDLREE